MKINNILVLILFILQLNSCGFKPVYSEHSKKFDVYLNSIQIEPISGLPGAELYHKLFTYLPLTKEPKYLLKINLAYSLRPQAIQKNSDIVREIVTQTASYQLYEINNSKVLTSGIITLSSSYNTSFSPYSAYIEREQTDKNLASLAAEKIRQRLILYFTSKASQMDSTEAIYN